TLGAMLRVMVVLIALTRLALADQASEPIAPPPPVVKNPLCAEGRTLDRCTTIGLVEIGFAQGKATEGNKRATGILPLQLGLLVNVSAPTAIGATLGLVAYNHPRSTDAPDDNNVDGSFGGFVRYRRWLCDACSVDVSVGAAANGLIGEVAFQLDDM